MDIASILDWLQRTSLAVHIRDSLFAFPLIESTHVIGLTLVFGTIAIIDLRLLGLASTNRSFQRLAADTLKWTWVAFAVSAATGSLMFITNAAVYYHNAYFRAKIALLLLAAINMLVFELTTRRTVAQVGSGCLSSATRSSGCCCVTGHLDQRDRHGPNDRLHDHSRVAGRAGTGRAKPRGTARISW